MVSTECKIFLSPGLTFMLPNALENEFSKRGRLGLIFEGGAYHIFEGRKCF